MSEINIRKAVLSDLPYFYEICLKTGNDGKDATDLYHDPYLLGHHYAAPYLLFPDAICITAEYQYRPQGYIIAAPDTISFLKWIEENWLPPLRQQYRQPYPQELIRSEKEGWLIKAIHEKKYPVDTNAMPYIKDYPAHLHIDMLPCLQGKGLGRALMDKLFAELKSKGVPGCHLGVSASNQGAVGFYKKLGFTVLKEFDWGLEMGKGVE
jgi:GNAT superfamily N-acetyltransferase